MKNKVPRVALTATSAAGHETVAEIEKSRKRIRDLQSQIVLEERHLAGLIVTVRELADFLEENDPLNEPGEWYDKFELKRPE